MTEQTIQKEEIERDVRAFVVENFLFGRADKLRGDTALFGGVIDSTGAMELVMFLQDRFAITVEDDEVGVPENFDSMKNVVEFVQRKLAAKASA